MNLEKLVKLMNVTYMQPKKTREYTSVLVERKILLTEPWEGGEFQVIFFS